MWFLLIEDERGLLQATVFRSVYERYGDLLHHRGAYLLDGRVEQEARAEGLGIWGVGPIGECDPIGTDGGSPVDGPSND